MGVVDIGMFGVAVKTGLGQQVAKEVVRNGATDERDEQSDAG